jgi:hypothetical protein
MKATKCIAAEEEITISYIDFLIHSKKERIIACKMMGFDCKCTVCSQSRDELTRRRLVVSVWRYGACDKVGFVKRIECVLRVEKYGNQVRAKD